ncbi:winged helix-turn-helix transcriptional regulator [Chryseobacterium sp. NFX27]|uniref:winged helix-turn-helix transcriptional regulator n=1 Tax=Chryseobacterium sp. NFX27 TaxID=2819618 RepID=UPI003CE76AC5
MSNLKTKINEKNLCPVNHAVSLLSRKYKLRILNALLNKGPKRFKVLEREIFTTVPPTVEYKTTTLGQTTMPMLDEIYQWGNVAYVSYEIENFD